MTDVAVERLREAIVCGEIAPGASLRLGEVAHSLGMSVSPIRDALRQLEGLGLVEHSAHHGSRVIALDLDELRHLFAIRLALETAAVRRAAERFTSEDAHAAKEQFEVYVDAAGRRDLRTAMREHTAFHFTIYRAARSAYLVRAIRPAWHASALYRPRLLAESSIGNRHQAVDAEIREACVARDTERAAAGVRAHLELAQDLYAEDLNGRSIFAF